MASRSYITPKDIERAENLNWRGNTFHPMGGDIAISKAKSMAKLIKDPTKLLGRLEAVSDRWGDLEIVQPFIDRVLELMPTSRYASSYRDGKHSGRYSMGPGGSRGSEERVIDILYNIGFQQGRFGN